jgi:hypothetical protein
MKDKTKNVWLGLAITVILVIFRLRIDGNKILVALLSCASLLAVIISVLFLTVNQICKRIDSSTICCEIICREKKKWKGIFFVVFLVFLLLAIVYMLFFISDLLNDIISIIALCLTFIDTSIAENIAESVKL